MNIIVLAGGLSPERDVSLISGSEICKALLNQGHNAFLLDIFLGLSWDKDKLEEVFHTSHHGLSIATGIKTTLPNLREIEAARTSLSASYFGENVIELCSIADMTFIALHGSDGENGKVQAAFDLLGIPYTGPNSLGLALSMNKLVAKQIFKMSKVPTPRGTSLTKTTKDTSLEDLGYYLPLVIKPCSGGSSIGVYIVHTEEEYRDAIHASFETNPEEEVVIEPYIKGREYACTILGGKALPLVEIIPKNGVFDYANKYQKGGATDLCPPVSLDKKMQKKLQTAGERAFHALRLDIYARADFIVDDSDGRFYCLEMNGLPGMTPTSLVPIAAKEVGLSYEALCETILQETLQKRYHKGESR